MSGLQVVKGLSVLASLALASLLAENLIPVNYIGWVAWVSGALAAAPAHIDRLFGFVSVHSSTIHPPPMKAAPSSIPPEWEPYDPENL